MNSSIPFFIPSEYSSGLASGKLIRIGTILKESATGKIVAHVQETGLAQQLIQSVGGSLFSPVSSLLNLASSGYANYQLNQLKLMVEGLRTLQYANLGVSIAGIGVSVIGFAMMTKRLEGIEDQINELAKKMDRRFQELIERDFRRHYSQIHNLFDRAGRVGNFKNPKDKWLSIEEKLDDESGFFHGEIVHLLKQDNLNVDLFVDLVRSLTLCNAGRIECLVMANELSAARDSAERIGHTYSGLFDDLTPNLLIKKTLYGGSEKNSQSYSPFRYANIQMKNLVEGLRDITDSAMTKPILIENLIDKKIDGSKYLSRLENEREQSILLLRHS